MHAPSLCAAARRGLLLTSGSRLACRSVTEAFLCRCPRPRFCAFCWRAGASSSKSCCLSEGKLPLSAALGPCLEACLLCTGLPGTAAARCALRYMPSGVDSCSLSDPEGLMLSPSGLQVKAGHREWHCLCIKCPCSVPGAWHAVANDMTVQHESPLLPCRLPLPDPCPGTSSRISFINQKTGGPLTWQIHWWSPHLQLCCCSPEHHCKSRPSCLLSCAKSQACHAPRRSQLSPVPITIAPAACCSEQLNAQKFWARPQLNAVKVCY